MFLTTIEKDTMSNELLPPFTRPKFPAEVNTAYAVFSATNRFIGWVVRVSDGKFRKINKEGSPSGPLYLSHYANGATSLSRRRSDKLPKNWMPETSHELLERVAEACLDPDDDESSLSPSLMSDVMSYFQH